MAKKAISQAANVQTTGLPSVESFTGWAKLQPAEQTTVKMEAQGIYDELKEEGETRIRIGEHLTKMRTILEPKRLFVKFLDFCFKMSRATAYRYMEEYRVAKQLLPAPVLELASIRHVPIREKVIVENPPPTTDNVVEIGEYLDRISHIAVNPVTVSTNRDVLLKECVNYCTTRYNRLPSNKRTRDAWTRDLFGMLMNKFGLTAQTAFTPVTIPASFEVQRGRPKEVATA
jgi:hypothetical protein